MASITEYGVTTSFTYDAAGTLASRTNFDGTVEQFEDVASVAFIEPASGCGTLSNPAPLFRASDAKATQYNELGEPTVTTTVNSLGLPMTETDALGNVTTYERNAEGRVTVRTDPDPDGSGPLPAPQTSFVAAANWNRPSPSTSTTPPASSSA